MDPAEIVREAIKRRVAEGLDQKDIAREWGVSEAAISQNANGDVKNPRSSLFLAAMQSMGMLMERESGGPPMVREQPEPYPDELLKRANKLATENEMLKSALRAVYRGTDSVRSIVDS